MSGRILAGFLAVLLMMVAGAAEPTRVVQAEEILKKIELGQPVEYDNVIVVGDLDLSGLNLTKVPVKRTHMDETHHVGLPDYEIIVASPISITNSVIQGSVNLNGTAFQNATNFQGTKFEEPVFHDWFEVQPDCQLLESAVQPDCDFAKCSSTRKPDFWETQFNQTH